jgi:LAS superfamily LD-carboxypeptidase LdcB
MDEIKAVRVRRNDINSGTLDIRVAIFKQNRLFGPEERIVVGVYNPLKPDGKKVWMETTYKKTGPYKEYTDDQFISEFINMNSKIEGKSYYIIQDPWANKVPIYRNYGSDPYYLNNGAVIYILWKDGATDVGGKKYSDDSGNELPKNDISFKKTIRITSANETKSFTLGKKDEFEYDGKSQEFAGYNSDKGVIASALSRWKMKIPNYNDLALCSPDNESCSIIPYKSPLQPIVPDVPATPVAETAINADSKKKEPIKINLQDEKVKVKVDVLSLKVYIGILKDSPLEPALESETLNTEQDVFIDGEGEQIDISEYQESDFVGEDEASVLEEQEYPSEEIRQETEKQSEIISSAPYVPGKYKLDLIPGTLLGNNKMPVKCCQIDGKPVNVNIADALLDLKAAAKKDGINNLRINSGFRPDYGPRLNTKSEAGVSVSADSQEYLYSLFLKKGTPDTAKPGRSKHGSGIAVDFNTGSRTGAINQPLDPKIYSWMVKNSWRFGFVRTVKSEEWHFEYWGKVSGPYAKLPKSNGLFYADLGLNNLSVVA